MIESICHEITLKQPENTDHSLIHTIYFGGGTPSILDVAELEKILSTIRANFEIAVNAEITLEANPEDINQKKLQSWHSLGINPLSIGIQTFNAETLAYVNRAHTVSQAKEALALSKSEGFKNITADLIFGIPPFTLENWEDDLSQMLDFDLPHLSVYGLTIEPKTVFGKWHQKGKLIESTDESMEHAFRMAHQKLTGSGYLHYEVSNYAKPGMESKHNTAYWQGKPYIGLGPGAHSFDGKNRSYNISNNAIYLREIAKGIVPQTLENLTITDQMNEYLFTRLRTSSGVDLKAFKQLYARDLLSDYQLLIRDLLRKELIELLENNLILTLDGMLLADEISLKLFYE